MLSLAAFYDFNIQAHLILSCEISVDFYPTGKFILSIFDIKPPSDFMSTSYYRPLPTFDLICGLLEKPAEEVSHIERTITCGLYAAAVRNGPRFFRVSTSKLRNHESITHFAIGKIYPFVLSIFHQLAGIVGRIKGA